jgi:hypothetical protein
MKATEANIRKILRRWRPRLGLDEKYTIEVRIYTDENWPIVSVAQLPRSNPR